MSKRIRRLAANPALVVSCLALAISLSGTAVAAGIVANARHADRADVARRALNADRVQSRTAVQIAAAGAQAGAQLPGPASTAGALVGVKTQSVSLAPTSVATLSISCEPGTRVLSGGFSSAVGVESLSSFPAGPSTWTVKLGNTTTVAEDVMLYVTCLK